MVPAHWTSYSTMTDTDAGADDWRDVVPDGERVRSVVITLSQPRPAGWTADTALVTTQTAQERLS